MPRCSSCLAATRDTDKYCSFCMKPLPRIEAPQPEVVAAPPPEPFLEEPSLQRGDEALIEAGARCWKGSPHILTEGLEHLTSVAAWRCDGHWALMTMGLTALDLRPYRYELSGEGYELTMRVSGEEVPALALHLLDRLATQRPRNPKVTMKGLPTVLFAPDGELEPLDTPNGRVEFERVLPAGGEVFDLASLRPEPTALDRLVEKDARPAVGLRFDGNTTGRSHRGGSATVPADFKWPLRNGTPLPLLLELDLSESSVPGWLPTSGRLLLFGLHDDGDPRVSVQRRGMKKWNDVFEVRLVEGQGVPTSMGLQLPHEGCSLVPFIDAPDHCWGPVSALLEELDEAGTGAPFEEYQAARQSGFAHQLLGHSHSVQDEAIVEALRELGRDADFETLEHEAMGWVALLQLESDHPWNFCGAGRLFIVGPRDAVAAGRLAEVRAVIQRS